MVDDGSLPNRRWARDVLMLALLAAATALTWWIWLGHDTVYQPWQVIGCGATFLLLGVLTGLRTRWRIMAVAVMALSFTVAWSIPASSDDTGLWGVGAIMVLFGTAFGATLAIMAGRSLRRSTAFGRSAVGRVVAR